MRFHPLYIWIIVLLFSVLSLERAEAKAAGEKKFTVVIDAGHGGKDIGATDNGVMEKNINLKVAKQLESLIKKRMKEVDVVMTRTSDTYLTLQQRADKANKSQGDLFISIHTNSADRKNKNRKNLEGSSVYTLGLHKDENNLEVAMRENSVIELEQDYQEKYSGFDPMKDESYIIFEMAQKHNLSQSIKLAEDIEKQLVKSGRKDRGVHQAGFWVLWATAMPSVLVELDFICNPVSAKYISSDKGAKELAEAIYKAIEGYEKNWNRSQRRNVNQELSDTYLSGETSELEDTYVISSSVSVAKGRVRNHQPSQKINQGVKERRRRSVRSKELSLNKSFETDNLYFPERRNYAEVAMSVNEELAQVNNSGKDVALNSKEAKRKEKEARKKEKEREKQEKKKRREAAHNAKLNKLITVYKIQILASTDLLGQNNARFCGLSPVTASKENNLYKYYYGESTDKEELEKVLADVRKKIPDAFIVSGKKSVTK
ncbi:MAG: N-acetylmuramoyl-L-alanine amidase [Muribaculaceae bacterium]|nr:N-acetylmuramoyl-L-alanine amidase [Muribaculaceae bacterium]